MTADRTRLIRLIHVAVRELALPEESYRDLLERLTGKRSSAKLKPAELETVLAELKRLGFKPQRAKKAGAMPQDKSPQARKVRALWIELGKAGAVRDRSEAALQHWFAKQTGIEHMRFARAEHFNTAIEALKDWCHREGLPS